MDPAASGEPVAGLMDRDASGEPVVGPTNPDASGEPVARSTGPAAPAGRRDSVAADDRSFGASSDPVPLGPATDAAPTPAPAWSLRRAMAHVSASPPAAARAARPNQVPARVRRRVADLSAGTDPELEAGAVCSDACESAGPTNVSRCPWTASSPATNAAMSGRRWRG